jgi:hypothetical protein
VARRCGTASTACDIKGGRNRMTPKEGGAACHEEVEGDRRLLAGSFLITNTKDL